MNNPNRHSRGTPKGGQFAEDAKAEAGGTDQLGDVDEANRRARVDSYLGQDADQIRGRVMDRVCDDPYWMDPDDDQDTRRAVARALANEGVVLAPHKWADTVRDIADALDAPSDLPTGPQWDDTTATCHLDDGRMLAVNVTGEGVIIDTFADDEHVGTKAMTADEWFDTVVVEDPAHRTPDTRWPGVQPDDLEQAAHDALDQVGVDPTEEKIGQVVDSIERSPTVESANSHVWDTLNDTAMTYAEVMAEQEQDR